MKVTYIVWAKSLFFEKTLCAIQCSILRWIYKFTSIKYL